MLTSLFCILSARIFEEKRDCSHSTDTRERITVQGCLVPRRLSREERWARKGGREGERMRDVWQILFSRWRNIQWRMITHIFKRNIELFVLRILKEKWFFLIQCARRKLFSYFKRATASLQDSPSCALFIPKNYQRNRL